MKCFICEKNIKPQNGRHIYHCAKKNDIEIDKQEIKYKQICYNAGVDFTKKLLLFRYDTLNWSLPDFKDEYGLNYAQTQFLLDYFKIKKRNIKEANSSAERVNKSRATCRKKYGVDNVSQLDNIKEKKKETFVKNYGVDNIWKAKEYYDWLHEHMLETYGKKSLPNRYGNMQKYWDSKTKDEKKEHMRPAFEAYSGYWHSLTDEQQNIIIRKRCKNIHLNPNFCSSLETRFCSILNNLCLGYHHQFWINRKSYDFRINHTKILIEVQGDYWHANPKKYKADDILNYPDGYKKASDIWKRDEGKRKNAEKYGYKIIYIWETEFINEDDEGLSKLIEERLKNEGL